MSNHLCAECGEMVFAGQLVRKQDIHALCVDPDMKNHKTLMRPFLDGDFHTFQIGYVDDNGKDVWL